VGRCEDYMKELILEENEKIVGFKAYKANNAHSDWYDDF
jgi:hypothetical protein